MFDQGVSDRIIPVTVVLDPVGHLPAPRVHDTDRALRRLERHRVCASCYVRKRLSQPQLASLTTPDPRFTASVMGCRLAGGAGE